MKKFKLTLLQIAQLFVLCEAIKHSNLAELRKKNKLFDCIEDHNDKYNKIKKEIVEKYQFNDVDKDGNEVKKIKNEDFEKIDEEVKEATKEEIEIKCNREVVSFIVEGLEKLVENKDAEQLLKTRYQTKLFEEIFDALDSAELLKDDKKQQ